MAKQQTRKELLEAAAAAQTTPPIAAYAHTEADPEPPEMPTPPTPPEQNTGEIEANSNTKKPKEKRLVSFYCNESDYQQIEKLARHRAVMGGERNKKGQAVGAGTIINEAVHEYVKNHAADIAAWESFAQFFSPDNLRQFIEEQKRLAREQTQREIDKEIDE